MVKFKLYISNLGENYWPSAILFEIFAWEKVCDIPPDGTAFAYRGPYFNCARVMRWNGKDHDEWVLDWIKQFVEGVRAIDSNTALELGEKPIARNGYANIALPGESVGDAFKGNLSRLREIKSKWDPKQRFNKWFPIPPA